jgi:hypothetical protein
MRFLGIEPAYVAPLGRNVDPDESVDVDDALVWSATTYNEDGSVKNEGNPTGYVWPEELWAEVGSGRRRKAPVQDTPPADDNTKEG